MNQPYILRSYKNALITTALLVFGFIVYLNFMATKEDLAVGAIVGVAMIIAMITGVRGMIQFNKGRKAEKNVKYYIALIGNSLGILYLVGTIVTAIRILTKIL